MENAIEIRHYVSRGGKDVFDEWLTDLADARGKRRSPAESTGSLLETSAIANRFDTACTNYESIWGRATESITRCSGEPAYCFCAEAIKGDSRGTLYERCSTSKTTVKGPPHETESQCVP